MATKKTDKSAKAEKKPAPKTKKAPAKKAAKAETPAKEALPRHPRARVVAAHKTKVDLAKSLAPSLARQDEDEGVIAERLKTASNSQLLRLSSVVEQVKQKFGDRTKLIAAIGKAENKSKDKDYLAHLDTFSLPRLLDLALASERRARA